MIEKLGPIFATAVFRTVAALPLPIAQQIGRFVGWLLWCLPGSYKTRAAENLSRAIPGTTRASIRKAIIPVGQLFFEMPYWWVRRDEQSVNRYVDCDNWTQFQEALALGKGVILLSPHAGCFELLGPVYSSRFQSTVLFRPPRLPWLQAWIVKMRSREKLTMAPANQSGVRTLVKTLKRGNTVGILPDQVPVLGEGVWAPFFGRPAYTMTLVERLQSLTGATIFILGAKRHTKGCGFTILHKRMDEPLSSDPVEAATQMNAEMEAMIRQMPDQYLWGYNRFRQPRAKDDR
ncbi:KDO2-lipid IV(A) lauroyltransferase [Jezberella montanilacus]|jgi:KDO2-lipid IV(A) lauroyltransferase|uniref:KDO2-lipid IV(A) lauroyltransferase n=1 Tax=Jezberella montanilacus TaxID=323426 RepID=A0A2T0XE15_9BURK|nr:lysophospholipid acyltransferase family protein [Jezberella montanilacus]PRY97151.1 KDO2-lipid IV(A) lauroyltransferase [Jezberella montanilacus]|eukprot:gene4023-4073_t